jgi:hypothetical protein
MIKKLLVVVLCVCNTSFSHALDVATHKEFCKQIANSTLNGFSLDSYSKDKLGLAEGITTIFNGSSTFQVGSSDLKLSLPAMM